MMIVAGTRVCSLCMTNLVPTKTMWVCPKHGIRTRPIIDTQVNHFNQVAGKGGKGSGSKTGKKRKKPKKMTPWWAGNALDT